MKRVSVKNKGVNNKKCSRLDIGTEAVSPVVGVMLMLVVTIITAAIVSGFAGGLPDTSYKSSNVALKATYSQTNGLTITNMGGSPVGTSNTVIVTRLTDTFGDNEYLSWTIDPYDIVTKRGAVAGSKDAWYTDSGSYGKNSFEAGDAAYVAPGYMQNGLESENTFSVNNESNVGKEFWVELCDRSGMVFAKTRAVITK
jgi:FlaG/FlaF family flagellin (archaellin)